MRKHTGTITIALGLVLSLLVAIPAMASGPGCTSCCRATDCMPWHCEAPGFAEGYWEDLDVESAAPFLGLSEEELNTSLWAGDTLAELIGPAAEANRDLLQRVRDRVEAQRYRVITHQVDYDDACMVARGKSPCANDCGTWCSASCPAPACGSMRVSSYSGFLNLRTGAGLGYSVWARVSTGTVLSTTGATQFAGGRQWVEVVYGGRTLWAAGEYLSAC